MSRLISSRRKFIQQTALCSLSLALSQSTVFASTTKNKLNKIGLITGVVEAEFKKDWEQSLRKVAAIGYTHLEYTKHYGNDLNYFKQVMKELRLDSLCGGSAMAQMCKEDALKKMIEASLELNKKYLVCYWPWMDDGNNKKLDDYQKAANALNSMGEICNREGIKLAFHNHDKEFLPVVGYKWGYEVLLKETNPENVSMLLDLYWCTKGGADAIEILQKNPNRVAMFHVKDMDNTPEKLYTCPGNGIIDFKKIFAQSIQSGVQYYTVEIDQHPQPMKCIEDSFQYLNALRF